MGTEGPRLDEWPDEPVWGVHDPTIARWHELSEGVDVTIVKWSSKDGAEHARYPGRVVTSELPAPWVVFETRWTYGTVRQAGLTFEVGDILREIFSPIHPYDVFAVYAPDGRLKGWYGNVTHPAFFAPESHHGTVLVWHDLYIDIVAMPDGTITVLDEDELAESGLESSDPEMHARVLAARDELVARFHSRRPPFEALDRIEVDTDP